MNLLLKPVLPTVGTERFRRAMAEYLAAWSERVGPRAAELYRPLAFDAVEASER